MSQFELSIVCPVGRHHGDLSEIHAEYAAVVEQIGRSAEFVYVLDGPFTKAETTMEGMRGGKFPVRVFTMANGFGEATALQFGFEKARGKFILTIPDRHQIDPNILKEVVAKLDDGAEMIVTRREPRSDALLNRVQASVFHGLIKILTGQQFNDLTCGVRGMPKEVAERLELYGDQHRFIPVIAVRCGYRVEEIPGQQHAGNKKLRLRGPGIYVRRLLDILNIYFLTKFTRKPLRFFGLIGVTIASLGGVIMLGLAVQKVLFSVSLADRPLLLLGALLFVLGVQVMSIGLLGEIVIFLSSKRDMPEVSEVRELRDQTDGDAVYRKDAV